MKLASLGKAQNFVLLGKRKLCCWLIAITCGNVKMRNCLVVGCIVKSKKKLFLCSNCRLTDLL